MYFKNQQYYSLSYEKDRKSKENFKTYALLLSIVFSAGFGIGYYIALLVQNQTKVFGIPAIIIAIFGGLAALFSLSKTIIDWFSAKKEKEKVPVLQFDSYVKAIESQIVGFADNIKPQMTYFVRIKIQIQIHKEK